MGRNFAGLDVARRASEVVLNIMDERNWNISEMAIKIRARRQDIYNWIKGEGIPDIVSLKKIHALGGDILYIVTGERIKNEEVHTSRV